MTTAVKSARLPRGGTRALLAAGAAAALVGTGVAGITMASAQTTTLTLGAADSFAVLAGSTVTFRDGAAVAGDVGGARSPSKTWRRSATGASGPTSSRPRPTSPPPTT